MIPRTPTKARDALPRAFLANQDGGVDSIIVYHATDTHVTYPCPVHPAEFICVVGAERVFPTFREAARWQIARLSAESIRLSEKIGSLVKAISEDESDVALRPV